MSLLSKIMLGLCVLAGLFGFYSAARTLKTHKAWRDQYNTLQAQLAQEQKTLANLKAGELDPADSAKVLKAGVAQLTAELRHVLLGRGRVWRDLPHGAINAQTGQTSVDLLDGHGLTDKTIVYIFEMEPAETGGRYLGEFKVNGIAGAKADIAPTLKPTDVELKRLTASRGNWSMYEIMPSDRHDLFEGLTEDDLKARMIGEALKKETPLHADDPNFAKAATAALEARIKDRLRDGKPAEAKDPPEYQDANKNYLRPLTDFVLALRGVRNEIVVLEAKVQALTGDKAKVDAALATLVDPQAGQLAFRKTSNEALTAEKAKYVRERDETKKHLDAVTAKRDDLVKQRDDFLTKNRELAAQLTKLQIEAARKINSTTTTADRVTARP